MPPATGVGVHREPVRKTLSDEVETGEKPEILKVSTQKLPLFSMVEFSEIGFFYRLVRPQAC